jgi:2-polyprenyl-3-methyl-5-hydroxy-6-metoxy-1,4-benzoquinol methylase
VGYLLASPVRRLFENPDEILVPLVRPGMTAVDIGSAMGFFSLPLARLVGPEGRVVCVDVQRRMLAALQRRARRRGLDGVIETRQCSQEDAGLGGLEGRADLVLAIHVVHETSYPERFIEGCAATIRPGGRLLIAEPRGHVSGDDFEKTRRVALECGLDELPSPALRRSRAVLLERPREDAKT